MLTLGQGPQSTKKDTPFKNPGYGPAVCPHCSRVCRPFLRIVLKSNLSSILLAFQPVTMLQRAEQERVEMMLKQNIGLLCQSCLPFTADLHIQGTLGVTMDNTHVFLVQVDSKVLLRILHSSSCTANPQG